MVATIDHDQIIIKHKGGDSLTMDDIGIHLGAQDDIQIDADQLISENSTVHGTTWDIGEFVILNIPDYQYHDLIGTSITITIVDAQSNTVILRTPLEVI
jgi:hypothetical protein